MSLQTHELTCGAAALATVLSTLGRATTEGEVLAAVLSDTSVRDSTARSLTARDLERAARGFGFRAVTLEALPGPAASRTLEALRPAICRIRLYEDFLHFVVVRDFSEGWVLIDDPAYGRVRVPIETFGRVWENGDRALVAVSGEPFLAWKDDSGVISVKRSDRETIAAVEGASAASLYRSGLDAVARVERARGVAR